MSLEGKVAIVTGASRGIGAVAAVEFARAGVKVACVARGKGRSHIQGRGTLEDTVRQIEAIGGDAIAVSADVAEEGEICTMVEEVATHFGRVDILVNNAALLMNDTNLFSDLAAMDHEMNVNFRGPLLAMRAVVPHMRKVGGGRIVNVSSTVALNVVPTMMTYGVSKLALERLSLDVAEQLRADQIACNVFRIDVPVHNSISDGEPMAADVADYMEPETTVAEGLIWILNQPPSYTSTLDSIYNLREREAIMPQRAKKPFRIEILPFDPAGIRLDW